MHMERILQSFRQPRQRSYTPAFRVEREARGWRVFDGDRAIAFGWPTFLDIWAFSPFAPDQMAHREPAGKVVDLYTVHNSVLNFGLHGWPRHWCDGTRPADEWLTWKWVKRTGAELQAVLSADFADGERCRWVLRIAYDPVWARYRYTIAIDAWKRAPDGFEPLNMMLAGALVSRPQATRWTHSVWEDPEGRLRRIVHSNALFIGTDYASDKWRSRNAPYRGAWIAYAAHRSFNPAVLIHATNVPIRFAICSQLFDEHIIWAQAGQDNLDADGLFYFQMETEFVNLGAGLARQFLRQAADPTQPREWRDPSVVLPFAMDTVNEFETPVDPWQAEDCPIIVLPAAGAGGVSWAEDAAHSGRRSIRLQARGSSERKEVFPVGAVCNVKAHRRYRLTGWIKTRGVSRYARLELTSYEYTYTNVIDVAASAAVNGTTGWTQVQVELDSGDEVYLMPKLVLYGPGTAWFDDVALTEVRSGA